MLPGSCFYFERFAFNPQACLITLSALLSHLMAPPGDSGVLPLFPADSCYTPGVPVSILFTLLLFLFRVCAPPPVSVHLIIAAPAAHSCSWGEGGLLPEPAAGEGSPRCHTSAVPLRFSALAASPHALHGVGASVPSEA